MARAYGSYPYGRRFESTFRYHFPKKQKRPVGQAVKTSPFHGGNTSSILVRVTTLASKEASVFKARWSSGQDASLSRWKRGFDSPTGHQNLLGFQFEKVLLFFPSLFTKIVRENLEVNSEVASQETRCH